MPWRWVLSLTVTKRWAAALLLAAAGMLQAQAQTQAATSAQPAFVLDIKAPTAVREVLERHLEMQRFRDLTDLEDNELARLLPAARQNTADLLATLGYFSPTILLEQAADPADGAPRRVVLEVEPGEPTLIREVHIAFSGPIASDASAQAQRAGIQALWPLRPGERFTQSGWDAAKQQALRALTRNRYLTGALASSRAEIDPQERTARLHLILASGPAFALGTMTVSGLERHDAELVRRLARLAPGESYDQTRLLEAQQRLAASGFFDSVFMSVDTTGDPGAATVVVQVRESKLQKLVLGIGVNTDTGARFSVEHTHHQLPLIGWRAVSKLLLDGSKKSLGTELTGPPDERHWRWHTSALVEQEQSGSFEVDSVNLRAGRSLSGDRIDRAWYLQYERALNSGYNAPADANALSANYVWTRRAFDSLIFPTRGHALSAELGGGMTLDGGREPFGRVRARWMGFLPLGDRAQRGAAGGVNRTSRIAARAEVGAVIARPEAILPTTQLFLTGGDNTVRGYAYRSIGVTLPDGQTAAGRYLAAGGLEWQRPISVNGRQSDWDSTVFVDAGGVANQPEDMRAKVGVGAGARWNSPVGPLQIDLAWGVATQKLRLHLSMGLTF
jgi:translocation and assembly module TamA